MAVGFIDLECGYHYSAVTAKPTNNGGLENQ